MIGRIPNRKGKSLFAGSHSASASCAGAPWKEVCGSAHHALGRMIYQCRACPSICHPPERGRRCESREKPAPRRLAKAKRPVPHSPALGTQRKEKAQQGGSLPDFSVRRVGMICGEPEGVPPLPGGNRTLHYSTIPYRYETDNGVSIGFCAFRALSAMELDTRADRSVFHAMATARKSSRK